MRVSKDTLSGILASFIFLCILACVFLAGYFLGAKSKTRLITDPLIVYDNKTVRSLDEPGVLGVISAKEFEGWLKYRDPRLKLGK